MIDLITELLEEELSRYLKIVKEANRISEERRFD
jgi:hypothetical protein